MMDSGDDLLRQKMSDQESLRQAVEDIKAGEKERAKQLLIEILQRDEDNVNAWLWMTRCVGDHETKRECFEHVLTINPHNEHAIKGLERLDNPASAPRRRKKTAKNQGRLVIGIVVAALVIAIILVVLWWAQNNKSEQPEQVMTAAVLITQAPTLPGASPAPATTISGASPAPATTHPGTVPTWTQAPTRTPAPTHTRMPTKTPRLTNTPWPTWTPAPVPENLPILMYFRRDT